jgi:hypothetical protein
MAVVDIFTNDAPNPNVLVLVLQPNVCVWRLHKGRWVRWLASEETVNFSSPPPDGIDG